MSQNIKLELIDPDPDQPRKHFEVAELAESMAANGLIVPILVRPVGERYVIVHGERRWRAAKSLGWDSIAAEIRDISPVEARWLSLVENVQRDDLSPIEEAQAYRAHLADGTTQAELGERIGKSQQYVADRLALLKLPDEVKELVTARAVKPSAARRLVTIEDPALQVELAQRVADGGLTVKGIEAIKRAMDAPQETKAEHPGAASRPPNGNDVMGIAVWAEQRLAFLSANPAIDLLERQNNLAEARIWLERAAGKALNDIEHGECDLMTLYGLGAALEILDPGNPKRAADFVFLSAVVKEMYKICPGIQATNKSIDFPENMTVEQWERLGRAISALPCSEH